MPDRLCNCRLHFIRETGKFLLVINQKSYRNINSNSERYAKYQYG